MADFDTSSMKEWIKKGTDAQEIIKIGDVIETHDDEYQNGQESNSIIYIDIDLASSSYSNFSNLYAIICPNVKLRTVRIVLFKHFEQKNNNFSLAYKSVKCCYIKSIPNDIEVKIIINGTKQLLGDTKYETSFNVSSGKLAQIELEELHKIFFESLKNLSLYEHEKVLQTNLRLYTTLERNSIMNHEFEEGLKLEKENAVKFYSTMSHLAKNNNEGTTKDTDENSGANWRDKGCVDGLWRKWIIERLDTQDKIKKYNELKDRINNKFGDSEI